MIALDSNIVLRLLTADDEAQYNRALKALSKLYDAGEDVVVTNIALCETAWVLKRAYKASKQEILKALSEILTIRGIRAMNLSQVNAAIAAYRHGKGDFADYLMLHNARADGCRALMTFDRILLQDGGFIEP